VKRRGRPRLSQHFLHDRKTASRIAASLRAPVGADVLEVGPGKGALTEHLLASGWHVTAVEIDQALAAELGSRWAGESRLQIVPADILEYRLGPAASGSWYVAGNLPYAITSPIVFHLLDQVPSAAIAELVLMVQREVAERLVAEPGSKQNGALPVGVKLVADAEALFHVRAGAFRPAPSVQSTVIRLTPHDRWGLDSAGLRRVRSLVRELFARRRKQLQKSLRTGPPWKLTVDEVAAVADATDIDLSRRPETLDIEEWLALERSLAKIDGHAPA
jgi:16S rRNA (adenine1518-N6/adenine1519-N6)-dimethyltransferase